MLRLLVDEQAIGAAQAMLQRQLQRSLRSKRDYLLGYPGGSFTLPVHTSVDQALWYATFRTDQGDRHINLLGFRDRLRDGVSNNIVVECNPPTRGIHRRSAGVFLEDPQSGTVFFGHRGRVGGGTSGVGRSNFRAWYRGNWQPFFDDEADGSVVNEALVISHLDDGDGLLTRLTAFVVAVDRFKQAIRAGRLHEGVDDRSESVGAAATYVMEFAGTKTIPPREALIAACDHGFAVEALVARMRETLPGLSIGNRDHVDAFAVHGRRRILVEVKTDGSTTSVYGGVGQLMVYGIVTQPTERWLVLPTVAAEGWRPVLARIGIRIVGYRGTGRGITIDELPS